MAKLHNDRPLTHLDLRANPIGPGTRRCWRGTMAPNIRCEVMLSEAWDLQWLKGGDPLPLLLLLLLLLFPSFLCLGEGFLQKTDASFVWFVIGSGMIYDGSKDRPLKARREVAEENTASFPLPRWWV